MIRNIGTYVIAPVALILLVFALGVGANTIIFSVVGSVVQRECHVLAPSTVT